MPGLKQIIAPILKRPWLSAAAGILLIVLVALIAARM